MKPQDLKTLQALHRQMLELETTSPFGFDPGALARLRQDLMAFAGHDDFLLRKISEIAPHLTPGMTAKHYVSWMVPVERLLQKELRDDEFLIYSQDGDTAGATIAVEKIPLVFVLHNLRSAFNVGSIFRTAECFGAQKIYLCGYTPLPTQEKLSKTAMGTDALVKWEEAPKLSELILKLKSEGFKMIALETTSHAKDIESSFAREKVAFVLGNERFGVDAEILNLCDDVRKISLRGQKNSLNVGVAAAIAAYEYSRQWNLPENPKS